MPILLAASDIHVAHESRYMFTYVTTSFEFGCLLCYLVLSSSALPAKFVLGLHRCLLTFYRGIVLNARLSRAS